MKRLFALILLTGFLLTACSPATTLTTGPATASVIETRADAAHQTLVVFAAASLTGAFTEIGKAFEAAHPGVTVIFNFAGSQQLRTQIEQGAPADVFASANSAEMNTLVTESYVTKGAPQVFLTNQLVVILPSNNPANLAELKDLARPGIKLVLAAEDVPVGKYARQALDQMNGQFGSGFKDQVLANVVSNEDNVKQVVAKVQLGEADAGIVYTSDAVAAPELKSIEIPADLNVTARYPIAPLAKSGHLNLAEQFTTYALSADAQATFAKWGFGPKP